MFSYIDWINWRKSYHEARKVYHESMLDYYRFQVDNVQKIMKTSADMFTNMVALGMMKLNQDWTKPENFFRMMK